MNPASHVSVGSLRRSAVILAACAAIAPTAAANPITLNAPLPSLDRWMYPFNATPGYRTSAPAFGSLDAPEFPGFTFDDRDAQLFIGFATNPTIPAGLGAGSYQIVSATVTIAVSTGNAFRYDPTIDDFRTFLPTDDPDYIADTDNGRPIELFGAAFRPPYDTQPFIEGTPSVPGSPFGPCVCRGVRYVYPTDLVSGESRDVSNNVGDRFNPVPWAIGTCGVAPGALVPSVTQFTFAIDVNNPDVRAYIQNELNGGSLRLVVTSLQPATTSGEQPGSGQYATFYTKENAFASGRAARLSLTVNIIDSLPGDADGDGDVDFDDLNLLLGNWGQSVPDGTQGDVTGDGLVDFDDLNAVLANWGATA